MPGDIAHSHHRRRRYSITSAVSNCPVHLLSLTLHAPECSAMSSRYFPALEALSVESCLTPQERAVCVRTCRLAS